MAEHMDPNDQQSPTPPAGHDMPTDRPAELEPMAVEAPRRHASAQFRVESDLTTEASLREAMDPANQSLAEALRLSYRVLRFAMVILVVLFLVSGIRTIEEGQSGVLTKAGRIVAVDGDEALQPGLNFSIWPYPIGQFTVFETRRRLELDRPFWPARAVGRDLELATESARVSEALRPEQDGSLLTVGGDLAHMQMSATYDVIEPGQFVRRISPAEGSKLVRLALQRAAVHYAARHDLQALTESDRDDLHNQELRDEAQRRLTRLGVGIDLVDLSADIIPPLAIRKVASELNQTRTQMEAVLAGARDEAVGVLSSTAGENYREAIDLIEAYEVHLELGEGEQAESVLAQLNELFESDRMAGEVSSIVQHANAYQSQVESTLGNEARRFEGMLAAFRSHPDLVIRERWIDTLRSVLAVEDTEKIFIPAGIRSVTLDIAGLQAVQEARRTLRLEQEQASARQEPYERSIQYVDERVIEGPGRQLRLDEQGEVRGIRQGR